MKHIAAALLLALAGKEINEKGINDILTSAGIKADSRVVTLIVNACKGKKADQIIAEGIPKLAAAVGAGSSPAAASSATNVAAEKKDDKKGKEAPKKKEEPKVEEEEDFGPIGFF